jgi:hypothetical protein
MGTHWNLSEKKYQIILNKFMIKNREEVKKEFDEKFTVKCSDGLLIADFKNGKEIKVSQIKSYISKIRKDDIDGLVEWVEKEKEETEGGRESLDVWQFLAHLKSLKEKV